jgi:predicted ArsR family transcriptional regulator
MQRTRERIMAYLAENHQAAAAELSALLDVTGANIRHHLGVLEQQGWVEVVGQTAPDGRGRPAHIYMATRAAQADGLANLARALLEELDGHEARLASVAQALRADAGGGAGHITARLSAAAARMTELNYRAHWEAHARGPHIILGNCPYAANIEEHPDLCRMDELLLTEMVGEDVVLIERFGRAPGEPKVCRFHTQ